MKKTGIIIGIIIIIIVGIFAFHFPSAVKQSPVNVQSNCGNSQTVKNVTISYKGENGIDALTLLKKQASCRARSFRFGCQH